MADGPLAGVRVVEASEGVAGPMTGRLLGDAGADVIKGETPAGDRSRGWWPHRDGTSAVFESLNRNKRSIMIGEPNSDEVSLLIGLADVLVIDDSIIDELALDIDAMMEGNPRLVVCVISGWGPDGPWAHRPGAELPAQLSSEATYSLGRPGEEPVRLGTDHAGMTTAFYAMQAITAALLVADSDGGQRIDVSLLGSLLHARSTMWVGLSNPDEWTGFHLDNYVKPPEHNYTCKDRRIYFAIGRVDDITSLVRDLKMEFVFDDPRWPLLRDDPAGGFGPHSETVLDLWNRGLSEWSSAEAIEIITRHGGTAFACLTHEEFASDEQVRELGLVVVGDRRGGGGASRDLRPPWQLSDTPASIRMAAPRLDEHGDEVRATIIGPRAWPAP